MCKNRCINIVKQISNGNLKLITLCIIVVREKLLEDGNSLLYITVATAKQLEFLIIAYIVCRNMSFNLDLIILIIIFFSTSFMCIDPTSGSF